MLDLIFAVLMVVIIVKANKGEVNDILCSVALVIGVLAGILGLVQAFFMQDGGNFWILNIIVMLIALVLKRVAMHFAKIYNQKREEIEAEYRAAQERYARNIKRTGEPEPDYNDPNVRFGGGDGSPWNGK